MVSRRATQTPLFPIGHHPVEKQSREHLPRTPLLAATEIPVAVLTVVVLISLPVLIVVAILLRRWAIVVLVALSDRY